MKTKLLNACLEGTPLKPCLPSLTHPRAHRCSFPFDPKLVFELWGPKWEVEFLRLGSGLLIYYFCPSPGLGNVYLCVIPVAWGGGGRKGGGGINRIPKSPYLVINNL